MSRRLKNNKRTKKSNSVSIKGKVDKKINEAGGFRTNMLIYGAVSALALWFLISFLEKNLLEQIEYNSTFLLLKVLFSVSLFFVISYKSPKTIEFTKYGFLFLILALIGLSIVIKIAIVLPTAYLFFYHLQLLLFVPTIALGVVVILKNSSLYNKQINLEFKEISTGTATSSLNLLNRLIKREGGIYLLLLGVIFVLGFFTFSYRLTNYDVFEDEFQMMAVSTGYFHTGEYKGWDLINEQISKGSEYGVKPQIWLLAQTYKVFGLSKETARGLSVFMGLLFIFIAYFVSKYFIKNRLIALLLPLVVVFFPPYLHLFRYIRMYALVIPLSAIILWLLHKGVTETNQLKIKNLKINQFIEKYINFNFIPLLISIPLIIINYQLHQVSLITVPVIFAYVVYLSFFERETKYYIATAVGVLGIIAVSVFFSGYIPAGILSFFEGRDWLYLDWMFSFPFSKYIVISVLFIGLPLLYVVKNRIFRNNIVYLYILMFLTFVFFALIANYAGHDFRFVSHVVPFIILLTVYLLYIIVKPVFNRFILYLLLILFIFDIGLLYSKGFESTYKWNYFRPWYSVAYNTIEENIEPEEVVFGQYFKAYYAANIYKKNKVIDMLSGKRFKLDSLKKYIEIYPKGWVTWATYKGWHFDTDLINYISSNFKQVHGSNLDSTNIEVYRYDKSMIPGTNEYAKRNINVFNTNTYIKMNKPYSISFWLKANTKNAGIPILFRKIEADSIACFAFSDSISGGFGIKYEKEIDDLKINAIYDGNWHHIVIYKTPASSGNNYGAVIDGSIKTEKQFGNKRMGEVQLLISTLFNGQMQDFRIYNMVLTDSQIQAIYNNGNITNVEDLWDGEKVFKPIKHFSVK
jgi:hypothetical protein